MSTLVKSVVGRVRPRRGNQGPLIAGTRSTNEQLKDLSESELLQVSGQLRQRVVQKGPDSPAVQIKAFALMREAIRRTRQIELYDVQILASIILAQGRVAEMQTGEGKTLACAPAAYLHGLAGRGVHVATPNSYLAERDFELLAPAFRLLGASISILPERDASDRKRAAYLCDVTYGTGYEFGFDYLRDQLSLRQPGRVLGDTLWSRVSGKSLPSADTIQRPLHCVLVDEIDNVLLDDAGSPLVLSEGVDQEAPDAEAHQIARRLATELTSEEDYQLDSSTGRVELTETGADRMHGPDVDIPISILLRSWTEYVEKALIAETIYRRDVHYVVDDGVVQIVDASTGRIFSDRTWQDGLHQAVEAKEGVRITAERQALSQITRQRFYRLYPRLCGMTGTITGCEREFRQIYGLKTQTVPLRVQSSRKTILPRFFSNAAAKWRAVADSATDIHATGRPVLIGTRSIDDSEVLAMVFRQRNLEVELLNGKQDSTEAEVVARAGREGAITIATNLAGRGTDIQLNGDVKRRGGLHVIVGECHESRRVDRQLVGRCARQGDPGTAQTFVSAEDSLLRRFGPWLADSMKRFADRNGEVNLNLARQVARLQTLAERQEYASRCALLRLDRSRDVLFSQRPHQT